MKNLHNVTITVLDGQATPVLSMDLYEVTQDEIDNQVAALRSVFILCTVEEEKMENLND